MKITPECVPCLLNRLLYEANLVDPSASWEIMKDACSILSTELSPDISSVELATKIHKLTYEKLGTDDPYKNVKSIAMQVGHQLVDKANRLINTSTDRIHAAFLCSVVGNVLDFGIEGGVSTPEELVAKFDEIFDEGLGHDDIGQIRKYLKKGAKIVFFTDNCGEIVFDKLLCQELKKIGVTIILVVKGASILSDATMEEAEEIGMDEVADEIINTGDYAVGFNVKNIPLDMYNHLNSSDLIISKGMANFEALSETNYKPVVHVLRTKCNPVAKALGMKKDINVAKLIV